MSSILDVDGHILMPRVLVEIAADQFPIIRPVVKSVGGGMNTDESVTRPDKVEESCLLRAAHGQFAGCEKHHGVITRKVFAREFGIPHET